MYRLGPAVEGGLYYPGDVQIRLFGGAARQRHRLLRRRHMGSAGVRLGVDRHRSNAHRPQRLVYPYRDFASIGYQDFGEHQ